MGIFPQLYCSSMVSVPVLGLMGGAMNLIIVSASSPARKR